MSLTSITIPCTINDLAAFGRLLSYWCDERFFPIRPREDIIPIPLVVVVNRLEADTEKSFKAVFAQYRQLHTIFPNCVVMGAGLEGDRDLYARGATEAKGIYGNKAGPNFLFFETMRLLKPYGGFTFQNEVDCYPLRKGWLTDLRALIDMRRFAWVIGSFYTGQRPIGRDIQIHFNGNAVYQSGSDDFIDFIDTVWQPRMLEFVDVDPNLAYDCWWAIEQFRAGSIIRNTSWELISTYSQYFCNSQFLINTLDAETAAEDAEIAIRAAKTAKQDCLFLHGHAGTPLVSKFVESKELDFPSFLVMEASESRRGNSKISDEDLDRFVNTLGPLDEVSPLTSPAAAFASEVVLATINPAIIIRELPIILLPEAIGHASYIGNWHKSNPTDHIWTGGGASALFFQFEEAQKGVRITLKGKLAPGIDPATTQFRAFGASRVHISENVNGPVCFELSDDSAFQSASIMIEISAPVSMEGDIRELGYVLFSIALDQLVAD